MSRPNSKVASEIRDMAQALSGVRRARRGQAGRKNPGMMAKLFPSIFKKSA
jgi:hypothetical protein